MTQEEMERKIGHNALRVKDGKIEHFDPHPSETQEQDIKEFEAWWATYGIDRLYSGDLRKE